MATKIIACDLDVRIPIYDFSKMRLVSFSGLKRKIGGKGLALDTNVVSVNAIKGITFELSQGDRLALIGHNGAGKTTLLKAIAGIYPLQGGELIVNGRIKTLLSNSLFFDQTATGYENIDLVGTLEGWSASEKRKISSDIEEFTELGEFLEVPLRAYSAGMLARLAFALSTSRASEVILIDENIAAGDQQFQEKAQLRLTEFLSKIDVIVLATHSLQLAQRVCNKGLVLDQGSAVFLGPIDQAISFYSGVVNKVDVTN